MASFPARRPTARSFSIGEYPTKTYKSLGGTIVRRSFGNRAINYALDMRFDAISQVALETIFAHYHGQQGNANGFTLPSEMFSDMSAAMASNMQNAGGGGSLWFYAEAPQVES